VQTANQGRSSPPPLPPSDGALDGASCEQPAAVADDARYSLETRLIRTLLHAFGNPPIGFTLWNGDKIAPLGSAPVATLHVSDRRTLLRLCTDPDLQFGELYSSGKIDVDGSILRMIEELYLGAAEAAQPMSFRRRLAAWRHRRTRNTLHGSRENIHHHYDIGNEFYALWLGETMAYTCAYFPTPTATLDQAQIAKMDHVCRKVRLNRGERVVEAGCGWGALALHMARHYGVKVRAFNISREQIAYARERAKEQGLANEVEFVEDDYRNISGHYDKFVSVGMLEHVGAENFEELGRVIDGCLKDTGLGLIHTIGRNRAKLMHRWIDRRIFPGAHPPSLKEMMDIFEGRNFSVLDVENMRLHYAKTLEWWNILYERAIDRVAKMFDERFVRMWRLYLLGSQAAFTVGELQLFQVVFSPGRNNQIPWARADIYQR
jgi:cyclopropane-fatty-acyl-phospholipid synthase